MSTVSESDIKELKEFINSRFDELTSQVGAIDKKLDIYIAKTDEKLNYIEQNLNDLKKQSEKQDNRLWLLISGLFLTMLGAIAKFLFFPNP
ncbi:conserved hypothetical protein [Gloeothece citriformis PCC 7424]|uniref:Uncharacterized protein n=1 Tax=Gloeothece citriformis (strain PCC 7424) TaxID=65393 RepID=B7KBR8_GLOC7|nr:hypothetical protein [Gloeothece citriformis]ACK73046.1 conserved hypothetical protein [Gloeothece citriformis PCC 7424]